MIGIRCRLGFHDWGRWHKETHQVPLFKIVNRRKSQVGWEYASCTGPKWRQCMRDECSAMQAGGPHD